MRLVLTLLVKDEVDFIELNINYHLAQGVDRFIVTDNGSTDGTREILEDFRQMGVLEVIDEPAQDYQQGVWVSRMAVRAYEGLGADWIIHSDADEFWWPETGDLKQTFAKLGKDYGKLVVPRSNFLPSVRLTGPFWKQMVYRETSGEIWSKVIVDSDGKMAIVDFRTGQPLAAPSTSLSGAGTGVTWPKMAHRGCSSVEVSRGNHTVSSAELGPEAPSRPIIIFHFPHLYYERMERIVRQFGVSLSQNSDLGRMPWARMYGLYQQGELFEWYAKLPKIETDAARLMEAGRVVEDHRLCHFFEDMLGSLSN